MAYTSELKQLILNKDIPAEEEQLSLHLTKSYASDILNQLNYIKAENFDLGYFLINVAQLVKGVRQNM